MTIEESAPKQLHDALDVAWPLIAHATRIRMASQLVMFIDQHGNYTGKNVNLKGGDDKGAKTP